MSARLPTIPRALARGLCSTLRTAQRQQRRWAQVHDVRFLATTQAPRNIAEKYREKLHRKVREEGLEDISQLKERYANKIQDLKKKDSVSVPGLDALLGDEPAPSSPPSSASSTSTSTESSSITDPPPPPPQAPRPSSSSGKQSIKPLSSILDLPKARALPTKELSAIWRLRHSASSNSLCAVIPTKTYTLLAATARQHPTFILPVPRPDSGAEIHFLQWVFDAESSTSTVLFTQLAEYKLRGEWAQPHTSITHYWDKEMAESQDAVLMAGQLVEGRGASVQDAQWLVMLMQRFYGEEGMAGEGGKRKLLEQFGKGDGEFSVDKLLEESEKLGG
jgi:ATP synthase mitochondrial F1 complex assembly factor 1